MSRPIKTFYFNIHDLVTMKYCCDNPDKSMYFVRRLEHFQTSSIKSSDIDIFFNVLPSGVTRPGQEDNLTNEHTIYDRSGRRFAKWEAHITNINENKVNIFFRGNRQSLKYLFFNFLEPIINYKLMDKGLCLVHASCFSLNDNGYIIHGYPYSGKTSILLRMLRDRADYVSDEMTIISKEGHAYSYPTPLNLCDYNFQQDFPLKLNVSEAIRKYLNKFIRSATNNSIRPTIEVGLNRILNNCKIVNVCNIKASCIINNVLGPASSEVENAENILAINQYQYRYFRKVLEAHIKRNRSLHLKNYWDRMLMIIRDFCSNTATVVLRDENEFEQRLLKLGIGCIQEGEA